MSFHLLLLLILLTPQLFQGTEGIFIKVDPPSTYEGGNFWVQCRVPRAKENRKVIIRAEGLMSSEFEVRGVDAPTVFVRLVTEVPCWDAIVTSCILERNNKVMSAVVKVPVNGCGR